MADPARRVAFELLVEVRVNGAYANLALPTLVRQRQLDTRDAALATELGYGTLRAQGTLDAIVASCSTRRLDQLDGNVLDLLRLGTYQQLRTRVPAHAAVASTVDLARAVGSGRAAGFVNAVLRKVTAHDWEGWVAALTVGGSERRRLALATAHPEWIVDAFAAALDAQPPDAQPPDAQPLDAQPLDAQPLDAQPLDAQPLDAQPLDAQPLDAQPSQEQPDGGGLPRAEQPRTEIERALLADDARPQTHLVALPGLLDRDVLAAEAGGEPGPWSPDAVRAHGGDPGALVDVRSGRAAVQDEGSQLVARALVNLPLDGAGSDVRWADLCAGPGGKAALLGAIAAQRGARVEAFELHPHRVQLVRRRIAPVAATVTVRQGDARLLDAVDGLFDRVLVDAPCTGLGALRRRPEARWRRQPSDVAPLVALQGELLDAAVRVTRRGGLIAYVTCSPHLAETQQVVAAALARTPGLRLVDARPAFPGMPELGPGPTVQLWPHRHGTDAMFCALLSPTG